MVREIEREARRPKGLVGERRSNTRFPLNLELHYTLLNHPLGTGSGTTCDISSSGLRFTADRPLQVGQLLRVSIDWPAVLHGGIQLAVDGVVVRTDGPVTALQIARHEFRTRRV